MQLASLYDCFDICVRGQNEAVNQRFLRFLPFSAKYVKFDHVNSSQYNSVALFDVLAGKMHLK